MVEQLNRWNSDIFDGEQWNRDSGTVEHLMEEQ